MKSKKTNYLKIAILLFLYCNISTYCQNKNENSIYNWFDLEIQKDNLPLNNGVAHYNKDRTIPNSNRYYLSEKFSKGEITYNNQNYYNLNVKYDILKDIVITNPYDDSNQIGIELTSENISNFKILEKKFINLSTNPLFSSELTKGFYEENFKGEKITLYIKHKKTAKEIFKNEFVDIEYLTENEFVVFHNNSFKKIKSKRDIVEIFPDHESKITDYYLMNSKTEQENKVQFMGHLIKYVETLLSNKIN